METIKRYGLFLAVLLIASCNRDEVVIPQQGSGYPPSIGKIVLSNCAVSGCHNEKSKDAASGLSLETWNRMFEGGRNGPCVIPYRPDFSTLCFYTNTYPELGVNLTPTMPIGKEPLSRDDYIALRDWIADGAPDDKGNVPFSGQPLRKKIYVTNLLCNVVTIFDSQTLLPMRYIDVGTGSGAKYPAVVRVSPDGQYWYVSFLYGNVLQKFRTSDDAYLGDIFLGPGSYHGFIITPNSKNAFCFDYGSPGKILYVDLEARTVKATYTNGNNFRYPRGGAINANATVLYVCAQFGNYVYKIDISNPLSPTVQEKQIDGTTISQTNSLYDPYEILFSTTGSKYYVACQYSNEIRVMQTSNDSLLAVIPVDYYPQQMAISGNYLFVTCPQDTLSFPSKRGSISVIDRNTNTVIKKIHPGWQPYGVAVDVSKGLLCVANMNVLKGPTSHHSTSCGGNNGYVTFVDLATLTVLPKKIEIANVPYGISVLK